MPDENKSSHEPEGKKVWIGMKNLMAVIVVVASGSIAWNDVKTLSVSNEIGVALVKGEVKDLHSELNNAVNSHNLFRMDQSNKLEGLKDDVFDLKAALEESTTKIFLELSVISQGKRRQNDDMTDMRVQIALLESNQNIMIKRIDEIARSQSEFVGSLTDIAVQLGLLIKDVRKGT